MASLGQNVGENPVHVLWSNKNTELEGGRQNMIGFSCMKAVYEHIACLYGGVKIVPDILVNHLQESRQTS